MTTPTPNVSLIYNWGYTVATNGNAFQPPGKLAQLPAAVIGLGVGYYYAGGIPGDLMTAAQAYLVGGVAVYAYAYAMGPLTA